VVGELILISYHVVVLDTVELSFKLPNFGTICIHLLTRAGPVFIELVDDQHRVPVYHDAFNDELNSYTKSMETCFIFGGVVGGRKMYLKNVSELILGWRDEQNARTSTVDVESAVKVHHQVLGASSGDGLLNLSPLSDKISKRLRLDGRPASKFNRVSVSSIAHLMIWPLASLLWRMSPRGNSMTTVIL
jgi:hypothetical protein